MARNYDELRKERDLDFIIGGNTFTIHLLPVKFIGIWTEREREIDVTDMDAFTKMCIDRVADAVADGNGAEERWRGLCESESAPAYGELLELARWAWEAQSDLPTQEPVPSEPGRGSTAVSSKGA